MNRHLQSSDAPVELRDENGLGIGAWTWDIEAGRVEWSPETRRMYGVADATQPTLQTFVGLVHPDDRASVMSTVSETMATLRAAHEHRFRIVRPDGRVRWILSRARLETDASTGRRMMRGADVDLGPEDSADPVEAGQRAAHFSTLVRQYQDTLSAAPIILFSQDRDLRYTWIHNPALGFETEGVLGRTDAELLSPDSGGGELDAIKREVLARGRPIRREVSIRRGGAERWYDLSVLPKLTGGEVVGVFCTAFDFTERKRAETALAERETRYQALFDSIDEGYCLCEMIVGADGAPVDYRFLEANRHFDSMTGLSNAVGRTAKDLVPDLEHRWIELYARAGIGREAFRFQERSDAMGRSFDVFTGPVEPHGHFIIVFRDVTERDRQAEQIRLLVQELSHRTKNILAVVQAVARQTATGDPETFVERFSSRVSALAASHDLLINNDWNGVDLDALVRSQLAHFADLFGSRITISGPPLRLAPGAASSLGMALHELSTNAGKYGALSDGAGRVSIEWRIDGDRFRMRWEEKDGPPVVPPPSHGFGSVVVQRLVEANFDADVHFAFEPTGVVWEIACPREQVQQ